MNIEPPELKGCLQVGHDGRIDIEELKTRLRFPSKRWMLNHGGGNQSAYMWFVAPDHLDYRDIGEFYRDATGVYPLKWDQYSEQRTTFSSIDIGPNECWFCVEVHPTSTDLSLIQIFIDNLDRHMHSLVSPAASEAQGNPVADTGKKSRRWFGRLFGL